MVDPTSDLNEDVSAEEAPPCTVCGAAIVQDPGHTVVTRVEGGEVRTWHFCSEGCRETWDGASAR